MRVAVRHHMLWSDLLLVDERMAVHTYNQTKGSRTEAAILRWVRTGHKETEPSGLTSPMAPWWRGLYGGMGRAIEMHEQGNVPAWVIAMLACGGVMTFGLLLICCLEACASGGREERDPIKYAVD